MDRELLLLGLLRHQDMHGYELHEFIQSNLTSCIAMKKATAYYTLDKLEAQGWVRSEVMQEGNRPPRKVYQITPAGEAEYQRLLRQNLATYSPAVFAGDIGLLFLDGLPASEARALLQQRREQLAGALAEAQAAPTHRGSMQLVIEHQILHLEAELDWLTGLIERW
jgi:DNA-binding PadR family transcriptional regulator